MQTCRVGVNTFDVQSFLFYIFSGTGNILEEPALFRSAATKRQTLWAKENSEPENPNFSLIVGMRELKFIN